jgi:SAM-dependent methyltransferase
MSSRALSFGSVAQAYERFRPGYPDELVGLVSAYAGRPITSALEIGAGTGKATRLFAAHGVAVTATEPDPVMLAELRRHVPETVRTVQSAFEQLDELEADATYDLVFAAASLHWTEPEGRWARVAAMLHADGVFASFGGPVRLADRAVEEAVRSARAPYLESDDIASPDGTPPESTLQWPGTELERSGLLTDVQQRVVERRLTMSAAAYVGYLSTVSAYLELPPPTRSEVLGAIQEVLPPEVKIDADVVVHLARRSAGR